MKKTRLREQQIVADAFTADAQIVKPNGMVSIRQKKMLYRKLRSFASFHLYNVRQAALS
jgi:hypothetical protein